jgi:hypothetical protein
MALETMTNDPASTLSADCTNSATTLSITSVSTFPTTGNFRIKIGTELILVGGISGSTFTGCTRGIEGTSAAAHVTTDAVTLVATKRSLVSRSLSALFGTGWHTPPVSADYTWVNQGGATVTETEHALSLLAPAGAGDSMRILKKTAPSTPYTITAVINVACHSVSRQNGGLLFRQSSDGKIANWAFNYGAGLAAQKFASATSYNSQYTLSPTGPPLHLGCRPIILRIEDDGTNRKCHWSPDGINFIQYHSVGRTDYLTADEVGFYANANNSTHPLIVTLYSWEQA